MDDGEDPDDIREWFAEQAEKATCRLAELDQEFASLVAKLTDNRLEHASLRQELPRIARFAAMFPRKADAVSKVEEAHEASMKQLQLCLPTTDD